MAIRKAWFIEEIEIDGGVGHRQTVVEFDSETGEWIRPDKRLVDAAAVDLWDDLMDRLSNVKGLDLRHCVNPVGLMDFCNDESLARDHRKRGSGNKYIVKNDPPGQGGGGGGGGGGGKATVN